MGPVGIPELTVVLVLVLLGYFIFGQIFSKAGDPRWLGLTMMVPLLNLVVLIWFAFADWPATRK
jgi:membrane protein DedA with SNARE-associated domain